MGIGIMKNLSKGTEVYAFDLDPMRRKAVVDMGGKVKSSLKEITSSSTYIFLSLPGPKQCIAVTDQLIEMNYNGVVIDTSTNDPETSDRIYEKCKENNIQYVACPVIGGQKGAENGSLTIIVGIDENKLDNLSELLNLIGEKVFFVGSSRIASAIKLVNNLMSIGNTFVLAEALSLANLNDIPLENLHEIIQYCSGYSEAYKKRWTQNISKNNYEPGYSISLAEKDLKLIMKTSDEKDFTFITPAISEFILKLMGEDSSKDISWIVKKYIDSTRRGGK